MDKINEVVEVTLGNHVLKFPVEVDIPADIPQTGIRVALPVPRSTGLVTCKAVELRKDGSVKSVVLDRTGRRRFRDKVISTN